MENDYAFAELLNDCLDAIERGEASVEDCLARHPQHAARLKDLLRLGDEIRRLSFPTPAPEQLAAGEERLLQAIRTRTPERPAERKNQSLWAALSTRLVEPARARMRAWPKWAVPTMAAAGSLVVVLASVLVVALGAGATWWVLRNRAVDPDGPSAIQSGSPTRLPGTVVAHKPAQTPEHDAAHVAFLPLLSVPLPPDQAMLRDVQGVVEFQTDGQAWAVADAEQIVQAGQRVRTGPFSGAQIVFRDGSVAHLGPESELSIDHLGQDPADESRIIELTQWAGESDHDVTPAYGSNARYEVHTPSGTGKALGTTFHVLVVPGSLSRFSVDDGAVAVVHLDVTVIVVAGQLTTVPVDQAPHEPFFRVTGEGEVTQIGETWEIGGQAFATHDQTVVVGNPQVGDWVSVDGHLLPDGTRVADLIVLLHRSPENRFTIVGEVESIGTDTWTVAGQAIAVGDDTELDEGIQIGHRVRVQGVIDESGALLAESIHLVEEEDVPFSFVGVVEEISDTSWVVSGVPITVDEATVIDDTLVVGDVVRVRGVFLEEEGGTWLARSIARVESHERRFEFVGLVESIDPWVVSGIEVETRTWTEIVGEIAVGDRVVVEGRILPDGTWLADEIKLDDEQDDLSFEFVGTVQSIDPWVVGGISLTVNYQTEIDDEIVVGDQVVVEGHILPDGTWLADEIKLVEAPLGRGCMQFTALVIRVKAGQLVLQDGTTIPIDGTVLTEGQIQVNSVILILLCIDDEGNVTIISIIVLYQAEPDPTPLPTATPSPPDDDDDDERNVTICHKPGTPAEQTKLIPQSAVKGHLGHGDHLGPCK